MGATNTLERVAASFGLVDGVSTSFAQSLDVPFGGLLFAVPALIAAGLLQSTTKHFSLPQGYYRINHIFMLLAFMALGRIRSIEQLRYQSPGEWGKILGLDRIPEARTLRNKLDHLSTNGAPEQWSAELCAQWMNASPQDAATLYVDGHVRVYHGSQTKLPRHYVTRERLCLRATTDYWVNAMDGQPFLLVSKAVDPGLLKALENDIVPRLEKEVPNQPTFEQLAASPLLHRFTIVFDREGYSPAFFKRMKDRRIACLSYHKYPGDPWPDEEFQPRQVRLNSGEIVEMALAERGTLLGGLLWVRELRKRTESGKQTAILCTNYCLELGAAAATMFARWSQENFFRYMREHYGLDKLVDYATDEIPESTQVVNPAYRELDGKIRSKLSTLNRRITEFGTLNLHGDIEAKNVNAYEQKKSGLQDDIQALQTEVDDLKAQRRVVSKHISIKDLPEEHRFARLRTQAKHLVDTIKMIAYRAETAVVSTLRDTITRDDDARSLARAIYKAEADILPDERAGTLTVRLHHLANTASDLAVRHLCAELTATRTVFPGTTLLLVYDLVSAQNPADQDV